FIFPLLLVLVIGLQFGGGASQGTLAVVGPQSTLRSTIENSMDDTEIVEVTGDEAREMVARERADAALIVPKQAASDYTEGADVELTVIEGGSPSTPITMQQLRNAVADAQLRSSQLETLVAHGIDDTAAQSALDEAAKSVDEAQVNVTDDN